MRYVRDGYEPTLNKAKLAAHKQQEQRTARMVSIAKPLIAKFNQTYKGVTAGLAMEGGKSYYTTYDQCVWLVLQVKFTISCHADSRPEERTSHLSPFWHDDEIARQIERDLISLRAELIVDHARRAGWHLEAILEKVEISRQSDLRVGMWLLSNRNVFSVVSVSAMKSKIMLQAWHPDLTPYQEPFRLTKDAWDYGNWRLVTRDQLVSFINVQAQHRPTLTNLLKLSSRG